MEMSKLFLLSIVIFWIKTLLKRITNQKLQFKS